MPNIKLKGQTGEVLTYEGVERVYFDSADKDGEVVYYTHGQAVSKTVEPNFASGDMSVPIAEGELVTELTIIKPENLEEENIKYGIEIAGKTGKFLGDAEEVTVDLHFPYNSVETELLPLTRYDGFVLHPYFPIYGVQEVAPFTLTIGETYFVEWDGEIRECVAQDAGNLATDMVYIGNGAKMQLPGNGEKFVIAVTVDGYAMYGSVEDEEAGGSHTVRIYQVTETNEDMVITPSAPTKVLSKVAVTKPGDAEQVIAKGKTLGGIPGEYVTPGTTKEIYPDFSAGDQIITAEGDERWNEVVVKKPETLIPENVAKDVNIGGVVGAFGGGGGDYVVTVIDYDGTVLVEELLNEGDTFVLPDAPTHEGLVFDGWSSPVTITNGMVTVEKQDIAIGPMYHTESGATEVDIVLTKKIGLTFTFLSKLTGMTSINWGDGITTGSGTLAHTYSDYGKYTIKIYGMTETASGSSSGGIVASPSSYAIVAVRFGSTVKKLGNYALTTCRCMTSLAIPKSVTAINERAFYYCCNLTGIVIPDGVTSIANATMYNCYNLRNIVLPDGITSIGNTAFSSCYSLKNIFIPDSLTSFGETVFSNCDGLHNIVIPDSVTSLGNGACSTCRSAKKIKLPKDFTGRLYQTLQNCNALNDFVIPDGVTEIGYMAIYNCYSLKSVVIPKNVTKIDGNAFANCYSLILYDFTACTSVPTLANTNAFSNINIGAQILVPSSLYDEWIAATNWSTYADYIVAV